MSLTVDCPSCGCPDQHIGLTCGFCNARIPEAAGVKSDGTATVEEIIGYRGWQVVYSDGLARLESPVVRGLLWEPGEWLTATCLHSDRAGYKPGHPHYHGPDTADRSQWSPVKGCNHPGHGCGFYAARTREHLIGELGAYVRYSEHNPQVIGKVQMAGKIIPATNGWRAQRVRPRVIYVPPELWKIGRDLKDAYGPHGVEVEMAATLLMPKDEVRYCKKCKVKMADRTTTCSFCGTLNK